MAPEVSGYLGLTFAFNMSTAGNRPNDSAVIWYPSRQVLRDISNDYLEFKYTQENKTFQNASDAVARDLDRILTPDLFDSYRNALDVMLHRIGPSIGLRTTCARANVTDLTLSDQKSVRCYNLTFSSEEYQIDCIRVGSSWHEAGFSNSQFSIGDTDLRSAGNISVEVYSPTRAITLNDTTLQCISAIGSSQPCDWDLMFSTDASERAALPLHQQYLEYSVPRLLAANATVVCTNLAYLDFLDYTIDVSPTVNALKTVLLYVPDHQLNETIAVHSDWMLAAWSLVRSGTVDGNRAAALNLISTLKRVASTPPPKTADLEDTEMDRFSSQHLIVSLHAVSLVDFTTTNLTNSPMGATSDRSRPPLTVTKTLRVWAYGHSSHTFRLGTVVSIFGCICVLMRVAIGLSTPRQRSRLGLIAAALRYAYQGEFDDLQRESKLAEAMIKLRHDGQGKLAAMVLKVGRDSEGNLALMPIKLGRDSQGTLASGSGS
jgi:hypothetical protein